jgi:hypothetical protein
MDFAKDSATRVLKETFKEISKENTNVTRITIVSYLDRHPHMD